MTRARIINKVGWLMVCPGPSLTVPAHTGRPLLDYRRYNVWAVLRGWFNAVLYCRECKSITMQRHTYTCQTHTTYKCHGCGQSGRWVGGIMV